MNTSRYLWAVVAAVLVAGVVTPAGADNPPVVQKPKLYTPPGLSIEVVSAHYGHGSMRSSCIVTPVVKRSCNGRSRCVVKVNDELCQPPNPLPPGLIQTLTVEYKCAPQVTGRTVYADKPFQVVIDCGNAAGQYSPKIGSTP